MHKIPSKLAEILHASEESDIPRKTEMSEGNEQPPDTSYTKTSCFGSSEYFFMKFFMKLSGLPSSDGRREASSPTSLN
ncbi:hypothetical protein TIFTF001_013622 [Ficus carica]|uniref:Uncharacterized protein n=1 Tax=Ficus carica TaxID=3494 RepID=A0AA88D7F5_FICCA|nr:hypothetical protein TIFTF001_013622 [Ficus carica]